MLKTDNSSSFSGNNPDKSGNEQKVEEQPTGNSSENKVAEGGNDSPGADPENVNDTPDAEKTVSGVSVSEKKDEEAGAEPTNSDGQDTDPETSAPDSEVAKIVEEPEIENWPPGPVEFENPYLDEEPFLDLQTYSAGGIVLDKGMMEIKLFNTLYTQSSWFNAMGERADLNRSNFYTSWLGAFYGISQRVDLGLDLNFRSVFNSPAEQSPLRVFAFSNTDSSRTTISSAGPKVRFSPIKGNKNLTMQSALWIPIAPNMQSNPFLDWDRYQLWISVYYSTLFGRDKFQFFGGVEWVPRISRDGTPGNSDLIMFQKALVSWFLTDDLTVYAQGEFGPNLGLGQNPTSGYYLAFGGGGKYFIANKVSLDLLYTNFVSGRNGGAGVTYNLGLSYIFRAN